MGARRSLGQPTWQTGARFYGESRLGRCAAAIVFVWCYPGSSGVASQWRIKKCNDGVFDFDT